MVATITHFFFFFFNDTATTEIYTLSLHDALPISCCGESSSHEAGDVPLQRLGRRGPGAPRGRHRRTAVEHGRPGRLDPRRPGRALLSRCRQVPGAVPAHLHRAIPRARRQHGAGRSIPDDVVRPRLAADLARAGDCLSRGRARPHPAPAAIPRFPNRPRTAGRSARRHGVRSLRARVVGSAGRCRRGVEGDPRGCAAALARSTPLILRPMTASTPQAPPRASRLAGYLLALAAGATWGTTGPLSTGLYALMPATSIGFWRVLLGTVCLAGWGLLFYRELFRVDRAGWLLVGLGGGALVALFEVAYQFAIAGAGVAGAAAMLYTAPVIVAILARLILKEALTPVRLLLSLLVMAGGASPRPRGRHPRGRAAGTPARAGGARGRASPRGHCLPRAHGPPA